MRARALAKTTGHIYPVRRAAVSDTLKFLVKTPRKWGLGLVVSCARRPAINAATTSCRPASDARLGNLRSELLAEIVHDVAQLVRFAAERFELTKPRGLGHANIVE
jgi:hypothetical protein